MNKKKWILMSIVLLAIGMNIHSASGETILCEPVALGRPQVSAGWRTQDNRMIFIAPAAVFAYPPNNRGRAQITCRYNVGATYFITAKLYLGTCIANDRTLSFDCTPARRTPPSRRSGQPPF